MSQHLTILTGASRGMGLAMAHQLLQPGNTLLGTSKNRCFQLNIGSGALQFPFVLIS